MEQTLAGRIASRRKELGISREDLAVAVGVSVTAVRLWEYGRTKNLKLAHLCAIADALNLSVRWLAEGRGPKEASQNGDAFAVALSRRDEIALPKNPTDADREAWTQQRKSWERIAAVFAKAATVILLAQPALLPHPAEASQPFNIIFNALHIVAQSVMKMVSRLATDIKGMCVPAHQLMLYPTTG